MALSSVQRRTGAAAAVAAASCLALVITSGGSSSEATPRYVGFLERANPVVGGANKESGEIRTALESIANARLAPHGSVAAGQLGASLGEFNVLTSNGSTWDEVTDLPYDADDPNYRDPWYSNSSGGAGFSAGRITGLAVGNGHVFAGGANGGVFRKSLGTDGKPSGDDGEWQPISDAILSLSTGDLLYDEGSNVLWYATGEANTGGTSYTGAGVYRLANATSGSFTQANRVGGDELESRGINQLKIGGRKIYAATTRGLWRHSATDVNGAWERILMPNPADDSDITKPYRNIVNDVAIDPKTGAVLANAAWRNGDSYNGFYLSRTGDAGTFNLITPGGAINPKDIGNTEFAYSADGSRLYAVVESPTLLQSGRQAGNSVLNGVYASKSGSVEGPWSLIADYRKLGNSGSALKTNAFGQGYGPGVQAWYNNFIDVDPTNPDHVYLGLEEVFETNDGGATWSTPGPYWNFGFSCWDPTKERGGCPETTHSDQHSVAFGNGFVFAGNDGGVKARPINPAVSTEDSMGHATDWINLSKGLHTLQYYGVGVGKDPDPKRGGYAIAGGLQDNGGSLIRGDRKDNQGNTEMVSPFGGDGGDIIVNPRNGCEILDEYVYLTLWMTTTCGESDSSTRVTWDVSVPDINPRFTAPFRAVRGSQNTVSGDSERWVAGGNAVWHHGKAFDYTAAEAGADASRGWSKLYNHQQTNRMTVGLDAIAGADPKNPAQDVVYAAWCGTANCNSTGFTRGVSTNWGGAWTELDLTGLPNRFPNAVFIDEKANAAGNTVYLVFNGYNRRFIEGPGAGVKHVFKGVLSKSGDKVNVEWTDISGNMPDVPATDVLRVGDKLVVGTDYGVLVEDLAVEGVSWKRVGAASGSAGALPLTTVFDLHAGPDGNLYAATHGRGIWSVPVASL